LPRQAQQLAMIAVALLTLESINAGRLRLAARRSEAVVLDLLRRGETTAARRAAQFLGSDLPDRVRVAVLSGAESDEVLLRLDGLPGAAEHVILAGRSGSACILLLGDAAGCADWLGGLVAAVPRSRAVLAAAADLGRVHDSLRRAETALQDAASGTVTDLGWHQASAPLDTPELRAWAERTLEALDGDEELVATVAAVLRRRSELDASRELGVHRHTVRSRVTRAESLLNATLDDPDTRARLWLALRLTGRA
jgi:purine catabolism regulator